MAAETTETVPAAPNLVALEKMARLAGSGGAPPVERWNPEYCGELDIRIARDGTWYYMGSPIGRKPLVKLFSSVLRKDADGGTYLVTPVEKIGITVDDAPFLAVEMAVDGDGPDQVVSFRTHVDDIVTVDKDHPLRFEAEDETGGLKPYVLVRGRLEALVNRPVFHDLVDLGVDLDRGNGHEFGVWSSGVFFSMAKSEEIGRKP